MRQLPSLTAKADLNAVHLTALGMGRYEPRDSQRFLGDLQRAADGETARSSGPKSDAEMAAMGIKVIRRG